MPLTLDHLRRYAIARSLFKPTTLMRAIGKLGFVQADPIRAPARAQDLTLRQRVIGYQAGELATGAWQAEGLPTKKYTLRITARDYSGNVASTGRDLELVLE